MTTAAVDKKSIGSTIPARVLAVVVIVVGHAVSANKVPFVRRRPALFIGDLVGAGIRLGSLGERVAHGQVVSGSLGRVCARRCEDEWRKS
ncbi:MAG TPA: hypothetical protein VMS41_02970 [Gaiellaceae bacterium]|nr:hypothetical protein [Gaiellaceae bacterium]